METKYNIMFVKIVRSIILFISLYLILKYLTSGKIPYSEILMICSSAISIQILLDIYRPIIVIKNDYIDGIN